jgi:ATP-dependent Clp endopeptidase proteolytic subunit ClpP
MQGHIYIDGEITKDYHLYVKEKLEALKNASEIVLHIQSPGGSVYGGYNTYHVLKSAGKKITAIIEGECQSIATFITLAADKITARNPSRYMIHLPLVGIQGNAKDLEGGASELRKIEEEMAAAYSSRTKIPKEDVLKMMEKETTFTVYEAKEKGFIDEVVDELKAVALAKSSKMSNEDKTFMQKLGEKFSQFAKEIMNSPNAMDLPLKAGGSIFVESETEDLVGKPAFVGEEPAPDGDHELADGRVIVTAEGLVTEVRAAVAAPSEDVAAIKAKLQALQAENEALKAAKAETEQKIATAEANRKKLAEEFKGIETEFQALKKRTVGDDNPPKAGKRHERTPVSDGDDNWQDEAKAELFKEAGLDWIKNLKQN